MGWGGWVTQGGRCSGCVPEVAWGLRLLLNGVSQDQRASIQWAGSDTWCSGAETNSNGFIEKAIRLGIGHMT
jgi:hypothetical protein